MFVTFAQIVLLSCLASHLEAFAELDFKVYRNPFSFSSDDEAEVEFLWFTSTTIENPQTAKITDEGQLFSTLNVTKTTKVVIHGWLDTWESDYAQSMINSFLPKNDFNVIVVNWPEADNVLYFPAVLKVPTVGRIVGTFLNRMATENGLNISSLHVIGHSLGAHVAAVAGYSLDSLKIGKVTGLDPALPGFKVGSSVTLSQKAADFVEVVHTCGNVFGIFTDIGHVDFYPNGGVPPQPGCSLDLRCSHVRSFKLYAEGISNSTAFLATQCSDWETYEKGGCDQNEKIYMNDFTPTCARGKYYYATAASYPYWL